MADAHGSGRGLVALIIVALREAKVDEHGTIRLVDKDIARLHIEVVHVAGMDIAQGIGNLTDVAQRISLCEATTLLHQLCQRTTVEELHHIVGRAILLKYIIDADDMRMLQAGDVLRLLNKLGAELIHHIPAPFRAYGHL